MTTQAARRRLRLRMRCTRTAASIRIVLLPDLPDKGDVSDWLDADPRRAEKLERVCYDVPVWMPGTADASPLLLPRLRLRQMPSPQAKCHCHLSTLQHGRERLCQIGHGR